MNNQLDPSLSPGHMLREVPEKASFRQLLVDKGYNVDQGAIFDLPILDARVEKKVREVSSMFRAYYQILGNVLHRHELYAPNFTVTMTEIDGWRADMEKIREYRDGHRQDDVTSACNVLRDRLGLHITRSLFVWRVEHGLE